MLVPRRQAPVKEPLPPSQSIGVEAVLKLTSYGCFQTNREPTMLCDHCRDCYELLTDVRVLKKLKEFKRTILRSKNAFLAVGHGVGGVTHAW